jgi:hypothetical protein
MTGLKGVENFKFSMFVTVILAFISEALASPVISGRATLSIRSVRIDGADIGCVSSDGRQMALCTGSSSGWQVAIKTPSEYVLRLPTPLTYSTLASGLHRVEPEHLPGWEAMVAVSVNGSPIMTFGTYFMLNVSTENLNVVVFHRPLPVTVAAVSYLDINGNGAKEDAERGLAGILVCVQDESGALVSKNADKNTIDSCKLTDNDGLVCEVDFDLS